MTKVKITEVYPCTIIMDRYNGAYSAGKWLAFNLDSLDVPQDIDGDDITCMNFWEGHGQKKKYVIGKGNRPEEAYKDLFIKLNEQS